MRLNRINEKQSGYRVDEENEEADDEKEWVGARERGRKGRKGWKAKERKRRGRNSRSSTKCKAHRGRLDLHFTAKLDHDTRKTSQGRPVFPSLLLSTLSLEPHRPFTDSPLWLFPFLEWAFIIGARLRGSLPGRTWSYSVRLVKHHFHTSEKQFNSTLPIPLASPYPYFSLFFSVSL